MRGHGAGANANRQTFNENNINETKPTFTLYTANNFEQFFCQSYYGRYL